MAGKDPKTDGGEAGISARLLLVDDNESFRQTTASALRTLGFRVSTAVSAEEALETYRMPDSEFDVLIIDFALPGMDGEELARRIWEDDEQARIVFASSYPREVLSGDPMSGKRCRYLQKPFGIQALKTVCDELLAL